MYFAKLVPLSSALATPFGASWCYSIHKRLAAGCPAETARGWDRSTNLNGLSARRALLRRAPAAGGRVEGGERSGGVLYFSPAKNRGNRRPRAAPFDDGVVPR